MWQVAVEDENNTTIYLDSITGQVLRHANDDFRLKDLMMKLHFLWTMAILEDLTIG